MIEKTGEPAKRFAVDALRKAVLDGDLVSGQRLVEPELAESLSVSRSSLRAALIDLTRADGLVELDPEQGCPGPRRTDRGGRRHPRMPR